jgi:ketosteroid isomerase-like protein
MSKRRHAAVTVLAAAGGLSTVRGIVRRVLLTKVRRDVRALNHGDYGPLLSGYAKDAVLLFPEGEHRWSGPHRGRASIEQFLREFTAAGVQGDVRELFIGGPLSRLTVLIRFDDSARGPQGERLYENRAVLLLRTRWGKIERHEDYFADTARIAQFEERLNALGIRPTAPART